MQPVLAQVIASICRERDQRFKDTLPLVQQLLSEYGEHDLANRLYAEIPRDVPYEVVADLFDLVLRSGNESCTDAIARSMRSWLRQAADNRKLNVALRVAQSTQSSATSGRHHRLSNVRRLMKALGLNLMAGVALFLSVHAQPRSADSPQQKEFLQKLSAAAIERTRHIVRYDPGYLPIVYPEETSRRKPASAPTKSSVPTARWALTCKKKSMRTCWPTFPLIPVRLSGDWTILTTTLTTAACPT